MRTQGVVRAVGEAEIHLECVKGCDSLSKIGLGFLLVGEYHSFVFDFAFIYYHYYYYYYILHYPQAFLLHLWVSLCIYYLKC